MKCAKARFVALCLVAVGPRPHRGCASRTTCARGCEANYSHLAGPAWRLLHQTVVSTKIQALSCCGLVLAGALSLGGCYAAAEVEPAYVETTYVPAHVHRYPHYYYEGRTVYLIDNRWYYRHSNGRWVYYRTEPEPLHRHRMTIRQAPPAPARQVAPAPTRHREHPPRHAPPAYYRDDGRHVTPPPPKKKKHYDDDHDDRDRDRDHDHDHDDRRQDDRRHDDHRDRY